MVFKFLRDLRADVSESEFKDILSIVTEDIKFNQVAFNKRTSPQQFINVCNITKSIVLNY